MRRMSEQSAKPYLVRAICEWCADNGLTPYLAVRVNGQTRVPLAYVKNGEIVLNVSVSATRKLTIDNEGIQFTARFNGASQEVSVPMAAVAGVFAKETGYGFAFTVAQDPVSSLAAATAPEIADDAGSGSGKGGRNGNGGTGTGEKPRPRPSHLQVVK
jgi:stringent starvation protein B